jgi:menaquinone-9 beta-reductase
VIHCDALVVGGGPAGSSCARRLRQAGWDVIVADRARFPRDKVCAGWLTPGVFAQLELDPEAYRRAGMTLQDIDGFRTGVIGRSLVETRYGTTVSYAVRRCEFDHFLIERAGVRLLPDVTVREFSRSRDTWIVNGAIAARIVIGAGGHFCPVARFLRGGADRAQPVVAREAEFPLAHAATTLPELFFCRDLEGYAWSVRKGNYVNIGIGRRTPRDFAAHVRDFVALLTSTGRLAADVTPTWKGHAYFAAGVGPRPLIGPGMLVIGDAAGLAYPESGEGIGPAIDSALLAAQIVIDARGRDAVEALRPYEEAMRRRHPPVRPSSAIVRTITAAAGRALLGSAAFTRHIVLNRWFLRMSDRYPDADLPDPQNPRLALS